MFTRPEPLLGGVGMFVKQQAAKRHLPKTLGAWQPQSESSSRPGGTGASFASRWSCPAGRGKEAVDVRVRTHPPISSGESYGTPPPGTGRRGPLRNAAARAKTTCRNAAKRKEGSVAPMGGNP